MVLRLPTRSQLSPQPVTQPGLYRLTLALILLVNDHLRAGFSRMLRGLVDRSVIDNQHLIELLSRSTNHVANVFLLVVSGNDRRDFRFVHYQRTTG